MALEPSRPASFADEVLSDVFRDAAVGLLVLDLEGTILDANPAFCSMLDATPGGLLGRSVVEFIEAGDRSTTLDRLGELARGERRSYSLTRVHRAPLGGRVATKVSGSVVRSKAQVAAGVVEIVEDVRPTLIAEQALRESLVRYRTIVEDIDEYIVRWLPDGTRTFVNDAYARYVGRPSTELIGTSFLPLIPNPEDRAAVLRKIAGLSPLHPVALSRHHAVTADGESRWHEWSDRGLFDEKGRLVQVQSVGRDVTEQRQAENAVAASERRFRRLFRDLPVACWESDWSAAIEPIRASGARCSQEWVELVRSDPQAMLSALSHVQLIDVNRKALELFGATDLDHYRNSMQATWSTVDPVLLATETAPIVFGERQVSSLEVNLRQAGGRNIDVIVEWARTRTDESDWRIVAAGVDITHRRNAEREIDRQRTILEQAEAIAGVGSWEWNPGSESILGSRQYWSILDGQASEAGVRHQSAFFDRLHPDDRGLVGERIQARSANPNGDDSAPTNFRILRIDGSIRHAVGRGFFRRDAGGNIETGFGILRDVTEQLVAEAEAEHQRQQLVRADKLIALGTLVSGVAHEINNPNQSIMLNAPLLANAWRELMPLLDQCHERDPASIPGRLPWGEAKTEIMDMATDILTSAERIHAIVSDLKGLAREPDSEVGRPLDLNEVARSAQRLLGSKIRKSTNRFRSELAPALPAVLGNRQRLEQVVINLLQNACDALPRSDRALSISTRVEGTEVWLLVVDEGVGIAPEHMRHLFDPFFTTRRSEGGMGLGLFISHRIVTDHGGSLHFVSQPGVGTTVTMTLPTIASGAAARA